MLAVKDKPVIFDCRVTKLANCFPMIPSGKAHNEMLMGEDVSDEEVGRPSARKARRWCEGQMAGGTESTCHGFVDPTD